MTESPRTGKDDDTLVHVKAQVMTSNDEIGGWIPMGTGGLSSVALRKRSLTCTLEDCRHEYLIHGHRLSDQSEVLNCILRKDLSYKKPNPTFHHWKTEERRFGLTFQTPGDARAFHKGVKRALDDLLGASHEKKDSNGDEDVFMTLDLPLGRKESGSNSASTTSTTTSSSPTPQSPAYVQEPFVGPPSHAHQHLHKIDYGPKQATRKTSPSSDKSLSSKSISSGDTNSKEDIWVRNEKRPSLHSARDESVEIKDPYYVQFAKPSVNEYTYPTSESYKPGTMRDSRSSSLKKPFVEIDKIDTSLQTPLPTKVKRTDRWDKNSRQSKHLLSKRSWCVYCHEMYVTSENRKGSCQDSPDNVQEFIEKVSCIVCARGMLYHCMADADGDYGHPCVCDADENNTKKWTALTLLSIIVPCLWCYWPLMACHHCGVSCGCCGGRHKAADNSGSNC